MIFLAVIGLATLAYLGVLPLVALAIVWTFLVSHAPVDIITLPSDQQRALLLAYAEQHQTKLTARRIRVCCTAVLFVLLFGLVIL